MNIISSIAELQHEPMIDEHEYIELTTELPFTIDSTSSGTAPDAGDWDDGEASTVVASVILHFSKGARRVLKYTIKVILTRNEYRHLTTSVDENATCRVIVTWTRNGLMVKDVRLSEDFSWHQAYHLG